MQTSRSRASIALVFALVALTVATVTAPRAQAADVSANNVTGGVTKMDVPFTLVQQLGKDRIFVRPIAPATLTYPNFFPVVSFPVTGGLVETATATGTINMAGGINIYRIDETYTNIEKQIDITNVRIVNALLTNQLVGDAFGLLPSPAADLKNPTHSYDPVTGKLIFEADAEVGVGGALVLNTYFNTDVFTAGLKMGHMKSEVDTARILGVGAG
jgi:hypothetical protein